MFYCSYDPGLGAYLAQPDHDPLVHDAADPQSDALAWCIAAVYGLLFLVAVVM